MKRSTRGRYEGSIEELPSGGFRARAPGGIDPATGKRTRPSRTFSTRPAAATWLADQVVKRSKGEQLHGGTDTLETWAGEWIEDKKEQRERATAKKYQEHLDKHILPYLGSVKLKDLTIAVLKKWLSDLAKKGVSASQRRKVCTTLTVCLNQAVRETRCVTNNLRSVPKPKVDRVATVEVYSRAEVEALLAAVRGTEHEPLFTLWLDLGCRPGELSGLHWPCVDLDRRTVKIESSLEEMDGEQRLKGPKTTAGLRTISVSPTTVALLRQHRSGSRDPRGPVFEYQGGFFGTAPLRAIWSRVVKRAGITRKKPSILRHTSAVMLLQAGVNIKVVSRRLGHSDIAITLRHYAAFLPEEDERAANAMESLFRSALPSAGHEEVPTEKQATPGHGQGVGTE